MKFVFNNVLKHLLDNGIVYTFRPYCKKWKRIVTIVNKHNTPLAIAEVEYVGELKYTMGVPYIETDTYPMSLSNYVKHSGFKSEYEWLNCVRKIYKRKHVFLYKVTILKYLR